VKKIFIGLAMMFAVALTATDAQAINLQAQRNQVFVEMRSVADEIRAELLEVRTDFLASQNQMERDILRQRMRVLKGRLQFIRTTRMQARYNYSAQQLDMLIVRYNLSVSQS